METILSHANSELRVTHLQGRVYLSSITMILRYGSLGFWMCSEYSVNWSFGLPQKGIEIKDVVTAILGLEGKERAMNIGNCYSLVINRNF